MEWARTFRIDSPPSEDLRRRVTSLLSREGVTIEISGCESPDRTYVLAQGTKSVDPAELNGAIPGAHAYPDAIIALAIEPAPSDALPLLARALGGPGAPAGVCGCEAAGDRLVIEFRPHVTPPSVIVKIADVELRRFGGSRRTQLISPLPMDVYARIAAEGLQAPEIEPARILECVLDIARVE